MFVKILKLFIKSWSKEVSIVSAFNRLTTPGCKGLNLSLCQLLSLLLNTAHRSAPLLSLRRLRSRLLSRFLWSCWGYLKFFFLRANILIAMSRSKISLSYRFPSVYALNGALQKIFAFQAMPKTYFSLNNLALGTCSFILWMLLLLVSFFVKFGITSKDAIGGLCMGRRRAGENELSATYKIQRVNLC